MRVAVTARWVLCCFVGVLMGCADATRPEPEPEIIPPELDFESAGVAYSHNSGNCLLPDCSGFVQLLFDGTLRVDLLGESPARLHVATVTEAELAAIRALAENPELAEYLSEFDTWPESEECLPMVSEGGSFIRLTASSESLSRDTRCSVLARELARELVDLRSKYVPGE